MDYSRQNAEWFCKVEFLIDGLNVVGIRRESDLENG
jgi:hypothetical protein